MPVIFTELTRHHFPTELLSIAHRNGSLPIEYFCLLLNKDNVKKIVGIVVLQYLKPSHINLSPEPEPVGVRVRRAILDPVMLR